MSNEPKTPAGASTLDNWIVTGVQTVAPGDGASRVEVVIRGKVEGKVDRGDGADQLRFSVWDDGQEMAFKVINVPLGKTGVITVRLGFDGRYAIVADGIGIAIVAGSEPGGERVFDLDPFFPEQK